MRFGIQCGQEKKKIVREKSQCGVKHGLEMINVLYMNKMPKMSLHFLIYVQN